MTTVANKLNASAETIFAKYLYIAFGNRVGTRKYMYVTYNRIAATSQYKCVYTYIIYATTGTNTYCLE